jgi:NAD(P)H-dependent flavin oxidoreductase YrpB (nitropropane dioxygenase family)
MPLTTRFTALFGVRHPIVCGGMTRVGTPELIAAVAEAGALGFLPAHNSPTPEDLVKDIARVRDLTDQPFGVNFTILPARKPPPWEEYMQATVDSGVTAVETAGQNPEPYLPLFQSGGVKVLHEAAGHPGEDDVPGLVLIPALADKIKIPFIASGGFADGRGLAAALALGAEGISMGTRFMCTVEAPIHDNVKAAIVANDERSTNLIFRQLRNTGRYVKNGVTDEIIRILNEGGTYEDVAHLSAGDKGAIVLATGDLEAGVWCAGQTQGLIFDVPTVAELVDTIVADAGAVIERMAALRG